MKCKMDCIFYIDKLDTCMFCDYLPSNQLSDDRIREEIHKRTGECRCEEQEKEEFDILKLDEESEFCDEWSHKKILNRLHNFNIDCYFVDMWGCDEVAFISGITGHVDKVMNDVAKALGIHKECIYYDYEHCFMILNLFQEKILRERESSL